MRNKRGITLASLVVYILLFTSFTVFVSSITRSTNAKLFDNRGEAINYSNLNKLQYNIENSSLNSDDVLVQENKISYSNGDNYEYNAQDKTIYKNGGILCKNVDNFIVQVENGINTKKINITVTFNKYLNSMTKNIVNCVEDM